MFFPFWRCAAFVPELLVHWAQAPPSVPLEDRNLGIVSLTRYIGQYPGRHLPRLQIAHLVEGKAPVSRRLFLLFLYFIMIYTSIYRDSLSLASAARA